ncbi:hypothetical protein V1460_25145 [Streptomyces sp. SCSIO 30461]|uniref:hypothetical protein n=1 Tax=Streptomyces sp. SCSIO 30461 TaxID=3118085 RepID=UPI0030D2F3F1
MGRGRALQYGAGQEQAGQGAGHGHRQHDEHDAHAERAAEDGGGDEADALGIRGSAVRGRLIALTGAAPQVHRGTHGSEAYGEHSACGDGEFAQ